MLPKMKIDPLTGKVIQVSKNGITTTAVDPFRPLNRGTGFNTQGAIEDLRRQQKLDADRIKRNKR